jgi:hypothetical protein
MKLSLRPASLLLLLFWSVGAFSADTHRRSSLYVPQCTGVTLEASYIADVGANAGPGFAFHIENKTAKPVRLAEPVPSSAHWYARVGLRWLWRASAGRGGALVNALSEKGPLFAYRPSAPPRDADYLTVPAHASYDWTLSMRDHPTLQYRPSCSHCDYPGERDYRAVFAWAYLPPSGQKVPDLLSCGLRSAPVPMPPAALRTEAPQTH